MTFTPEEKKEISLPKPDDIIRLAGNWTRDVAWAALAALSRDIKLKPSTEFWPQTLAQWFYPSLAALTVQTGVAVCFKKNDISFNHKKFAAGFIALSLAIITWNLGQMWGENFAKHKGMSNKDAGFFAGIDTGSMEGPLVQFFLYEMLLLACHEETQKRYKNYLNKGAIGAKRGVAYFATNIPTAIVAGAVWQFTYNALFPDCKNHCTDPTLKNVIFVAAAVGFAVLAANYMTNVANNMLNLFFDKRLPIPEESRAVTNNDEDSLLVSSQRSLITYNNHHNDSGQV